jgi:FeS assembly SUF system protein
MDPTSKRVPLETMDPFPPSPADSSLPTAFETDAAAVPPTDLSPAQVEELEKQIVAVLCTCFDPEIPVNIYELGLVYNIDVKPTGAVEIKMTLTSPACPVAGSLPPEVQAKLRTIPGVTSANVEVVWEPPWDKDRMSEAAKLQLGIDDF